MDFDFFYDLDLSIGNDCFLCGEVRYNVEYEDCSFDYEYGSIKGTYNDVREIISEIDFSEVKVYHEDDEINRPLTEEEKNQIINDAWKRL